MGGGSAAARDLTWHCLREPQPMYRFLARGAEVERLAASEAVVLLAVSIEV